MRFVIALLVSLFFTLPAKSECMDIQTVREVPTKHPEYSNVRFVSKEYASVAIVLFHWVVGTPNPEWDTAMLLDEKNGGVTVLIGTKEKMCGAVQLNEDDWIKLKPMIEPTKA